MLVAVLAFNEGNELQQLLMRFPNRRPYDVLVIDDGSTDGTVPASIPPGISVLRNPVNVGLGASMKRAFRHALATRYDVIVIMAGNGKDDPAEIERLVAPILAGDADFVQGSRFLDGGCHVNMPRHRLWATRYVHPLLFSACSGTRVTESTNGFRALRTAILEDPLIDWEQSWLDCYELEQYLQFKIVRLGYRRKEVPVSKRYPAKGKPYTKVKPILGWWSVIKPIIYLRTGLKR